MPSTDLNAIQAQLDRIERFLIADMEVRLLGHRIHYDKKTGWSINVPGSRCNPELLDDDGYQVHCE